MLPRNMSRVPLRIAYGRIFHEANAYSPIATTLGDFERMHLLKGDALANAVSPFASELKSFMPHAELSGFALAAKAARNVETVPLLSALAVPSGPLERGAFDELLHNLLDRLRSAGRIDGVYLALHGSMQVAAMHEAPEGRILREVRQLVGASARIAVSYDLHANLSAALVDPADILISYRSNPHWDLAPTGYRAGKRLIQVLRGEIRPTSAYRKLPMVLGGGMTIDFFAPMKAFYRAMKAMERRPGVVSTSFFMVHPYTTAKQLGWAVHVTTNDDQALADAIADELAELAWALRKHDLPAMLTPAAAIAEVRRAFARKFGPVTFIDVDDVVGAGAPGGNTRILEALVASGDDLTAYVPIHDPALVAAHAKTPLGQIVDIEVAGTLGYHMPAVRCNATVAARTTGDFGDVVRFDIGNTKLVATSGPPLPIHPGFWRAVGLDARRADILVQKNFFHYRIFYATTSFMHIPVVTGGATSLGRLRTQEYPVPMHPKDQVTNWRAGDRILRSMDAFGD
jgi:microcystin degradation protein MlrC